MQVLALFLPMLAQVAIQIAMPVMQASYQGKLMLQAHNCLSGRQRLIKGWSGWWGTGLRRKAKRCSCKLSQIFYSNYLEFTMC